MMLKKMMAALAPLLLLLTTSTVWADSTAHLGRGLSFCGEPADVRQADVFRAIDQNLVLLAEAKSRVWLTLKRSTRYQALVERELKKAGVPDDLKYIPLAITGLAPEYNSVGRGIWRLREAEAKSLGLRVDRDIDERLDPVASTAAAAKRLSTLKAAFGSWTTAMAAHMIGDAAIGQAVTEAGGETNYYKLYLPDGLDALPSTVLAGKVIFSNPQAFGYTLADGRGWPPFSGQRETVKEATTARALAAKLGKDYKRFRDANPHLLSGTIPAGTAVNIP
ncbi:transglycosylase SLT domain-containing protein [Deltaproteobacteria bacterium OttesenSCG-928-M10]|nr:transglycosylase SLT domain-containing protein [Deltaproteobacteria bacterium OttesenSCG-928-M10]